MTANTPPALDALTAGARAAGRKGPPPVHLWNPPYCGEIDMRIAADGTWFYGGTPIGRPALVRLFASVLRRDPERFVLVTPVEMVGITVEDAPFMAVEMTAEGDGDARRIGLRTNVDDWVTVDAEHPLRFVREATDGLRPYVRVRGGLEARLTRTLFYDLVALGEERVIDGVAKFGVAAGGSFFAMADASEIEGLA
ncbi:hypothetical protein GCM10007036_38110 [Alsobacter metallidurans]|uniref:DUF1285 domain-containing protein n=1 Tax=Alsobacter metallidurans TaxID=340221 RepID=A0A917I9Q6_9HYPH|nr:DUF1285 domain-containing protein [Alsobacter metallidurans]GGH28716.1 hypothetical protein GCM10007036_38110 [Alsobacter metallidurans]